MLRFSAPGKGVHPTRLYFLPIRVLYGIGNSGLAISYGLWLGLRDFLALAMLPLPPWPSTPSTPPPFGMRCGILIRFWSYTRSFRLRQSAKLSQADQNHWPTNPRRASETVLPLVCFWVSNNWQIAIAIWQKSTAKWVGEF